MSYFFISYRHLPDDMLFVQQLIKRLAKAKISAWADSDIAIGDDWHEAIDLALTSSYGLILITTPEALESEYVKYEWIYALGAKKEIIPIVFEGFQPEQLPERLRATQYVSRGDKAFWKKLIKTLYEIKAEYARPDYPLAVVAIGIPRIPGM